MPLLFLKGSEVVGKKIDVKTGDRYGFLEIISELETTNKRRRFLCKCDCGNEKSVDLTKLRSGNTRSCGCYQKKVRGKYVKTHGLSKTRIYIIWAGMKDRCLNDKHTVYSYYGGRGISFHKEWLSFEPFYEWAMSNGYEEHLTLDRINNDGDYEPTNCRWVTMSEQGRNTRKSIHIEYKGDSKPLKEWSDLLGIEYLVLYKRLRRGWSVDEAFNTPLLKSKHGRRSVSNEN